MCKDSCLQTLSVLGYKQFCKSEAFLMRKTVSFDGQMMSKDKYKSIFSHQMEAIVFITLQTFLQCADKMFANNLLFAALRMLDFQCSSTVPLYEQINNCLFCNNYLNTLSIVQ